MLVAQLDYIYFSFGLVLFLLGAVCVSMPRTAELPIPWWLLGAFAFAQGSVEWLHLLALTGGDSRTFGMSRALVSAATFTLLLEFARRTNRILHGVTPGPWLYFPLMAAQLGLGAAFGPAHIDAAVRLLLAASATAWTSALFFAAAARTKASDGAPAQRRALWWAGFHFGAFGLAAGVVVPGAPFLPVRWPSPEALLASTGVPIQLVRALFVCGMAFSVWALAVSLGAKDRVLRKRWTLFWVMASSIAALLVGGWLFTDRLGRLHERDAIDSAESSASQAYGDLGAEMAVAERGARSLAALLGRLRAAETPVDSARLAELVDALALATGDRDSVAYVLDPSGRTISASNRGRPDSFEGRSFAGRPYFEAAVRGRPGRFLGLGLVSKVPGYFASEPVRDAGGRLVAVAVVKRNLGSTQVGPPGFDGSYVVSAGGLILVASQLGHEGRPLWGAVASPDADSPGARPAGPAILDHAIQGTEWASAGGHRHVGVRRPIPGFDWSLVFLRAERTQVVNRLLGIVITLLLSAVVLAYFVAMQRQYGTESRISGKQRQAEVQAWESAQQAGTDALTGVLNRLGFNRAISREFARTRRSGEPLSLVMLDLDNFKRVNDAHGHAAGDAVLVAAARLLQANVRESDLIARWGGEEFVVVASLTPEAGAVRLAEKLRALLQATALGACGAVTGSFGVAELQAGDTVEGLLHQADQALYRAKSGGRDRVECAGQDRPVADRRATGAHTTQENEMSPYSRPYPDTGFAPIDREHRALSETLEDFVHKVNAGRAEEIRLALESVIAGVTAHFAHEEALMQEHAYPGQHRHVEAHGLFVGDARSYQAELLKRGVTLDFRRWAVGRLLEWFRFHICTHDVGLGQFLRKAGAVHHQPPAPRTATAPPQQPAGPDDVAA